MLTIAGLYIGTVRPLLPAGKLTGMFKHPVAEAAVEREGLMGDEQADRLAHGGPEQAVHQYALSSYSAIVKAFPALANIAVAGSIGENISAANMNESSVYIGDIYQFGGAQLQISQPRSPCWKINDRFNEPKLVKFVAEQRLNGWYYRVLKTGKMATGNSIERIYRPASAVSVDDFLAITAMRRPPVYDVGRLLACEGLSPEWQQKLTKRQSFLRRLMA